MMRLQDWEPQLVAYLRDSVLRPFKDGEHDCALFSAGGVLAMTGRDYAAPYRGRYTTQRGGIRILRRDGFRDHIALAAAQFSERPVAFARPGDLAVVKADAGDALGIVQGEGIYLLAREGLTVVPLLVATRVFEV